MSSQPSAVSFQLKPVESRIWKELAAEKAAVQQLKADG
jgi:hypothetical protein